MEGQTIKGDLGMQEMDGVGIVTGAGYIFYTNIDMPGEENSFSHGDRFINSCSRRDAKYGGDIRLMFWYRENRIDGNLCASHS
ncbi:MAG: hypothetical protein E6713_06495 [Sporomusaceae bacterium]|nr:hypothetical protein [Sporomusaceae bacterium]